MDRFGVPARAAIVSDTHGSMPRWLSGVLGSMRPDVIVHAGDVGAARVLVELESIAPVVAVRGNTDHGQWAEALPVIASFLVGESRVRVVHDAHGFLAPSGTDVLISGHTHRPSIERRGSVLMVNPGSAARPRSAEAKPTLAVIEFGPASTAARIVTR